MKISKLNIAVLTQFAGLLALCISQINAIRLIGVVVIVIGGVLYRREQKRLGVWERVANDIAQHGFARVSKALGRQLLGLDTQQQRVSGLR